VIFDHRHKCVGSGRVPRHEPTPVGRARWSAPRPLLLTQARPLCTPSRCPGHDGGVPNPPDDGLADLELAAFVTGLCADAGPSARVAGAGQLRAAAGRRAAARPRGPELPLVVDLTVDGEAPVPVRLYRPTLQPRPLLVYFHGGGWTIGGLASHDRLCRQLARGADVAVLAVDYRRAPEHPWPAALQDALTVVRWARQAPEQVATSRVGVAGDSAGGNLAALCCLSLRDAGEQQPAAQVLAYPNTDLTLSRPSVQAKGSGWGLDADDARWFVEQWVPDPARRADPRVSPLLEPDLIGLAPAVVVTAEHDPLRDEGDAYAAALSAAGVPVTHRSEAGLIHGFLGLDLISPAASRAAERLFNDVSRCLR
jgi:acetyl esterase